MFFLDNLFFNGTRYGKDENDKARMLLFDATGKVAGIQMAVSCSLLTIVFVQLTFYMIYEY